MPSVATLTLNPAIDAAFAAPAIRHTHKVRTSNAVFTPGGGGINVSRLLKTLGVRAETLYLAGGTTGDILENIVLAAGLQSRRFPIRARTRISFTVFDIAEELEYRFVPVGPSITPAEWEACLAFLAQNPPDILVASGSLAPGIPESFHAHLLEALAGSNSKVILDTSGPALQKSLEKGGVYLVTPSLNEFEQLVGHKMPTETGLVREAKKLVQGGNARQIAVTMGEKGALLVTSEDHFFLSAPKVQTVSAVGAGDSFVAGMTAGLVQGWPLPEAFRLGMAAGAATVGTPRGKEVSRDSIRHYHEKLDGWPFPGEGGA